MTSLIYKKGMTTLYESLSNKVTNKTAEGLTAQYKEIQRKLNEFWHTAYQHYGHNIEFYSKEFIFYKLDYDSRYSPY